MKDYQRICKVLEIRKCSRAIDFVEKWQRETQKADSENVNPNTAEEEAMDACKTESKDEDNAAEMLAFSNKPRQSAPHFNKQVPSCGSEASTKHDDEYKSKWFQRNSQFLTAVVQKGVNEFVKKIDGMIHAQRTCSTNDHL